MRGTVICYSIVEWIIFIKFCPLVESILIATVTSFMYVIVYSFIVYSFIVYSFIVYSFIVYSFIVYSFIVYSYKKKYTESTFSVQCASILHVRAVSWKRSFICGITKNGTYV